MTEILFKVILGLIVSLPVIWFYAEATGWYRCPVCGEWVRLGVNATNCEQSDGSWILCHGESSHRHIGGWRGIGAKAFK